MLFGDDLPKLGYLWMKSRVTLDVCLERNVRYLNLGVAPKHLNGVKIIPFTPRISLDAALNPKPRAKRILDPLRLLAFSMKSTDARNIPRYIQIADSLLDQIESGELEPGTRLPSERKLSELFEVNRLTLRRALGRLEAQGLLVRQHGKGNYVAEPKIERQTRRLVSFTHGMEQRGFIPGAKVITLEKRPVEAAIAKRMEIPVLTLVYYGYRLRSINQEPVMLEKFWMPAYLFPNLENHDLTNYSTYRIMESEYGISMLKARHSFEPAIATEYEAGLLEIEVGFPLMLLRRLGFDKKGRCVEYGKDLYRGDRFRFVTEEAFAPGLHEF